MLSKEEKIAILKQNINAIRGHEKDKETRDYTSEILKEVVNNEEAITKLEAKVTELENEEENKEETPE